MELLPVRSHWRAHEDEQHQHARRERVVQVDRIVDPRIVQRMCVDDDGLQESHGLVFRRSLGVEHRAGGGSRGQFAHHLHVLVEQRAGNEQRVVGVERHLGLPLGLRFGGSPFWNVVEAVDVAPLHGLACLGHVGVVGHDGRLFEGVEVAHQLPRGGRHVFVHHAHRHVLRQPRVHQRGEEHVAEQRCHYHAEQVERTGDEALSFTLHHVPQGFVFRCVHFDN